MLIIIDLMANLFQMYIVYRFMNLMYGELKIITKSLVLAFAFYYCANSFGYIITASPMINILTNLLGLFVITVLYSKSLFKNIFVTAIIYALGMAVDIIITLGMSSFMVNKEHIVLINLFTNLVIFIVVVALERMLSLIKGDYLSRKLWFTLLLVPAISIMILYIVITRVDRLIWLSLLTGVAFLVLNFVIFMLYDKLTLAYEDKIIKEEMKIQLAFYQNQREILEQSQYKVNSLRHDFKHHLSYIHNVLRYGQSQTAIDYIDKIYMQISNQKEYVRSGNYELDAVMNYQLSLANEMLDKVVWEVKVCEKLGIDSFDLVVILGNIMQNAMEASAQSTDKKLAISISEEKSMLIIQCKNSCIAEAKMAGDVFPSTKQEKENHGIGLLNVKRVVEKYNGTIKFIPTENSFTVFIIISMKK